MFYTELAKQLYQDGNREDNPYFGSYQPIVNHFGEVVLQVDTGDYQGDTHILYRKDNLFGYLSFGWGSCSGCDALQACSSYEECGELIQHLEYSIKWETKEAMLRYFKEHDWDGDYTWYYDEFKEFVTQVIDYLESN